MSNTFSNLQLNRAIFREYDVRGIAARDLSPDFAELLGLAYAKLIANNEPVKSGRPQTVAIGRDCRLTGDGYAKGLERGLRRSGIDVVILGVCPTPLTYFSTFHLGLDGAIMITGSHNPSDYNGFKICVKTDTLHGHQIQDLYETMRSIQTGKLPLPQKPEGKSSQYAIIPAYQDWVVKNAKPVKKKKIVIDSGNGVAGNVAPELFERMGAEVIPLFCELDGNFPNHHPDPTVVENLRDLIAKVKETGADFGLAFDGDADRIGLVDEKGGVLYGDEIMVLLARDVLKDNPGATIISEVKSSYRLYQDIAKHGGKPIMWKTGHSLIKSKLKETKAALAGEMSGHIFFADRYFGYDDAIYSATRVYEIASQAPGLFSTLIADLPKTVTTPEIRVDCQEEKKFALVDEVKKALAGKHEVVDIDGVRVEFGNGWGLLRASNTQPVLVLRFEAPNAETLQKFRTVVETALHDAAKKLGHPPISTQGASH